MQPLLARFGSLAGLMAVIVALAAVTLSALAQDGRGGTSFDHMRTGFPLTGAHAQIECQDCHVRGIFKGTPHQCELCHTQGSRVTASSKPASHVLTMERCEACHSSTVTWMGARYNHTGIAPGDCLRCHNGRTATGKPANHVQTAASCDTCHRTTAWIPASFSHASVSPGTCTQCHGSTATGKPGNHFVTARQCDACHTTTAWTPVKYTHTSSAYSLHNSGVTCIGCHKTNNEVISWQYGAYVPFCAGCHAGDFKQTAHKKTEVPSTIFYTVDELKNCAGSCHQYTDSTFSTILKARSGEHRSTDGGF